MVQPFSFMPLMRSGAGVVSVSLNYTTRSVTSEGYESATGTTESVTATPSGSLGPFAYSWSCTAGWTANSPSSATTTFTSPAISYGSSISGTGTVTVTDTSSGFTAQASVSLSHTRNLGSLSLALSPALQEVYLSGVPDAYGDQTWTVVISGGSGSYSYSWEMLSGDTPAGGPSGGQITLGYTVPFGEYRGSVWRITATDSVTGASVQSDRAFTFFNNGG